MNSAILKADYTSFFNKKTVVSFFLSLLVILLHNHSFDGY